MLLRSDQNNHSTRSDPYATVLLLLDRSADLDLIRAICSQATLDGQLAVDIAFLMQKAGKLSSLHSLTQSTNLTPCQRLTVSILSSNGVSRNISEILDQQVRPEYHCLSRLFLAERYPQEPTPDFVDTARDIAYMLQRCDFLEAIRASTVLMFLNIDTELILQFRIDAVRYLKRLTEVSTNSRMQFEIALLEDAMRKNKIALS